MARGSPPLGEVRQREAVGGVAWVAFQGVGAAHARRLRVSSGENMGSWAMENSER